MVQERSQRVVEVAGCPVPLSVRRSRRARQIALHVDPAQDGIELVLPGRTSEAEGLRFLAEKEIWVRNQLAILPPRIPFTDGARVPVLGVEHVIRHEPAVRGVVERRDGALVVSGRAEHLARRLRDWLRAEARRELSKRAAAKARIIGRPLHRVTVRDTRSRWGSCSANGSMSFSWRLILAPEFVLDYVVAHEVAHLVEMNHSPRFWRLARRLTADCDGARAWLHRRGAGLHRYG